MEDNNSVFIGGKPFIKYITGVVMQFTAKNRQEVIIKARGKFIQKSIDVAESIRKRFLKDKNIGVKNVKIGSEEMENQEGKKMSISTIEITLAKNKDSI